MQMRNFAQDKLEAILSRFLKKEISLNQKCKSSLNFLLCPRLMGKFKRIKEPTTANLMDSFFVPCHLI